MREATKKRLEKLKSDKADRLQAELLEKSETPGGLDFCRAVCLALVRRINEFKEEMTSEREALQKERSELKPRYELVKGEAAAGAKSVFKAKSKIEEAVKKFKVLVDREASIIFEVERREKAIDFFAFLLDEVNKLLSRLDTVSTYCKELNEDFKQKVNKMVQSRPDLKPFLLELRPNYLTEASCDVRAEDFLGWLKGKQLRMIDLGQMRAKAFEELLLEYGRADKRVIKVAELGVEDVLNECTPEGRARYINLLDRMAVPLWQYDQGVVSGERKTENIYLFGVCDRDQTVFEPNEISKSLSSPYLPQVVSTGDPRNVVCFKIEAAVPAYVIRDMVGYRTKYLSPEKPFSYHLHKDWEKELPDLFPGAAEDESRKYWSLALADPFNLIVKQGEYYYIKSEKKGKKTEKYLVKLAQGRREAMKKFVGDSDLVQEVKDVVERINRDLGNQNVVEKLAAYGNDLTARAGKQTEEIRDQIEQELEDIDKYIQALA